jgi:ABC-type glycerol-3-phosphate transport system substrate-binding protein
MSEKRLSRRQFLGAAAAASAASVLAACAPAAATQAPAAEEPAAPPAAVDAPVKILCRTDIKGAYAVDKAVEAWNAAFPKSPASLDEPPSGSDAATKIQASQAADDLIWDAFMVMEVPWGLVEWVKRGIVAPLDDYIKASTVPNADKVLPAIISTVKEASTYEGKFYGFPGNIGSVALAWFWEPLKAAGYDKQPETWDEVYDASKKIKEAKPELTPFASAINGLCDLYTMIFSAKENPFDADGLVDIQSKESIDALKWMRKMVEEGLMPASDKDQFGNWLKGGIGIITCFDVAGTMAQQTFGADKADTGISFFPEKGKINAGAPFWMNSSVVLNKAKNPQGGADFFLHMFGPDNKTTGKQITDVAAKPAYQYTIDEFVKADKKYEWELKGLDLVAKSKSFPRNTYWGIEHPKIGGYIQKCLDVSQTFEPEKAMADAYKEIKDEIAKQKIE